MVKISYDFDVDTMKMLSGQPGTYWIENQNDVLRIVHEFPDRGETL